MFMFERSMVYNINIYVFIFKNNIDSLRSLQKENIEARINYIRMCVQQITE